MKRLHESWSKFINVVKKSDGRWKIQLILVLWGIQVCIGSLIVWFSNLYFFYMTTLSYWGLTAYMIIFMIPGVPQLVKSILYSLALTLHVIVPIIFWSLLSEAHFADTRPWSQFYSFCCHGGDFVVIFIHFIMYKHDLPIISIVWNTGVFLLYAVWAWVGYAATGKYVYPFIDFSNELAKFAYPGLFVLVIIVSSMWVVIHRYRNKANPHYENMLPT